MDEAHVREWWRTWPVANIGVTCGAGSNLLVLDVDGEEGLATLCALLEKGNEIPVTPEVRSGSGGAHVYFRHVDGLPNAVRFAPGLDLRTEGGFVIGAGSRNVNGEYAFHEGRKPGDVEIQPAPMWLIELVRRRSDAANGADHFSLASTEIAEGQRNDALYRFSRSLHARGLGYEEILAASRVVNERRCVPPLAENEVAQIARNTATQGDRADFGRRGGQPVPKAALIRMADIMPEPVTWVWRNRIPGEKLSLIVGDPGLGKSFVTLDVAARVSRGRVFPDGARCERGSVVILSAEDGIADTIRPRLGAQGADLERVHLLTIHVGGTERLFDLGSHLNLLEETLDRVSDVRMVVIDPLSAYLGDTDPNKDSAVRALLTPLAVLAARKRVAIVGVIHLNKAAILDAVYRVAGSIAFIAQARAAWVVAADPKDPTCRLFLRLKSNLSRADVAGLAFRVQEDEQGRATLIWSEEEVNIDCREVLGRFANRARSQRGESLREAQDLLTELLADSPRQTDEIEDKAAGRGVSKRSLERARRELDIHSFRRGGVADKGGWWQSLPGDPRCGCKRCHHPSPKPDGGDRETASVTGSSPKSTSTGETGGDSSSVSASGGLPKSANLFKDNGLDELAHEKAVRAN